MPWSWKRRDRWTPRVSRKPHVRRAALRVEELETRTLLSLNGLDDLWAVPARAFPAGGPVGYSPAQVRQAYGFDRIAFDDGSVRADGAGQTIAIVTAYDHPGIEDDLRAFSNTFGLPMPPRLTRVNQFGGTTLPRYDPQWALETALDVQWAHAIAPGANLLLVHANSARLSDMLTAVDYARHQPGVVAVSMSWGTNEFSSQSLFNRYFTTPAGHVDGAGLPGGVTFVAASGDSGKPSWPAASANVVAVGGSRLDIQGAGNYVGEVAWRGSGGGVSRFEARPDYQAGVVDGQTRALPDVSYGADPATGFAVYATLPGLGQGWFQVGGTSAGAPQWAGLVALAAQGRNLQGRAALAGGPGLLYTLPDEAFFDITLGANDHAAGAGFDLVTGRGSPRAERVLAGLLAASDDGAPAGPSLMVLAAGENETPEPPELDAGTLALIAEILSELATTTEQTAAIPMTPGRLSELPPPVPQPVLRLPPVLPVVYKVGGMTVMLEPEELGEPLPERVIPQPPMPQAAAASQQPELTALNRDANPPREQAQVAGQSPLDVATRHAPEAPAERSGLLGWISLGGMLTLVSGWWLGRVLRGRSARQAGQVVLTAAER